VNIIRSMPEGAPVDFRRRENVYPVRGVPTRVHPDGGDLLFLAYGGRITGVAYIIGIRAVDNSDDLAYLEQGPPPDPASYVYVHVGKARRLKGSPPYKGHMGIRYVDRIKDRAVYRFLRAAAKR
jgi:hypothetical protein